MRERLPDLVDARWLQAALDAPDLVLLDASWYMPADARDADAEFAAAHIPGARRFDFDRDIADQSSALPHMLPAPEVFQGKVRALGVRDISRIVIYDGAGIFAAPRAWWMFKAMGHVRVAVLDGGLPAWRAAGGAMASGTAAAVEPGDFEARPDARRLADAGAVLRGLSAGAVDVVDARAAARFQGMQPEPRAGLRSGHMPGARNLPFGEVLADAHYRDAAAIRAAFHGAGISGTKPIIASCGSGVTASVLALAAEVAGLGPVAVYDGSWSEWGQETRPDLPVITGTAAP